MTLRVGAPCPEALRDARVLDAQGLSRPLGELLGEGLTLILFLRHFGCIGCSSELAELAPRLWSLRALGVRVLLLGCGPPEHIGAFVERHGLGGCGVVTVTDPTLGAQRSAGLYRSVWRAWGPRAVAGFVSALSRGHLPRSFAGDVSQQGGAVMVGSDGGVLLAFRARHLGDPAPLSDAVDAALRHCSSALSWAV